MRAAGCEGGRGGSWLHRSALHHPRLLIVLAHGVCTRCVLRWSQHVQVSQSDQMMLRKHSLRLCFSASNRPRPPCSQSPWTPGTEWVRRWRRTTVKHHGWWRTRFLKEISCCRWVWHHYFVFKSPIYFIAGSIRLRGQQVVSSGSCPSFPFLDSSVSMFGPKPKVQRGSG